MTVTVIVGAQWGDEGKGRVIDYLASQAEMVVRFQGGDNAGHTVVNDLGRFALHLIPSRARYRHPGPGGAGARELARLAGGHQRLPELGRAAGRGEGLPAAHLGSGRGPIRFVSVGPERSQIIVR